VRMEPDYRRCAAATCDGGDTDRAVKLSLAKKENSYRYNMYRNYLTQGCGSFSLWENAYRPQA
jgi:hypothetical protein